MNLLWDLAYWIVIGFAFSTGAAIAALLFASIWLAIQNWFAQ